MEETKEIFVSLKVNEEGKMSIESNMHPLNIISLMSEATVQIINDMRKEEPMTENTKEPVN